MAGTISEKLIDDPEFLILRSIYYNQSLPSSALRRVSSIYAAIDSLTSRGYLSREGTSLKLTTQGKRYLKNKCKNQQIPMIDFDYEQMLDNTISSRQYVIGISLAHKIRERIRNGR